MWLSFETFSKIVIIVLLIFVLLLNTCLSEALQGTGQLKVKIEQLETGQKELLERIENLEKLK